jgi:ribosomal-protein-alanine N-acetyltransferase
MTREANRSKIEPLETLRLRLIPSDAALLRAEIENPEEFSMKLAAKVPQNWPPETMRPVHLHFLQQLEQNIKFTGWLTWYWLLKRPPPRPASLIGCGGFKGPPRQDGRVEIGYSVLPSYRNHGYATEAVASLIDWAFSHPAVTRISAETEAINRPSIRVLEKLNFVTLEEASPSQTLLFELQRR